MTNLFAYNGDGWWPRIDPSGRLVVFGNVDLRVVRLFDGKVWHIGAGRSAGWLSSTQVSFTRETGPTTATRHIATIDELAPVDAKTGQVEHVPIIQTADNPTIVAGNDFDVRDGHWASCLTVPGRLTYDGVVLGASGFRGAKVAGEFLLTVRSDTMFCLFRQGILIRTIPLPAQANAWTVNAAGDIGYGYYWPARAIPFASNTIIDLTVTPWKRESPPRLVIGKNGQTWAFTMTVREIDQQNWIIGRPMTDSHQGSLCLIAREMPAADFDVVYHEPSNAFVIAACNDKGVLKVVFVDAAGTVEPVVDIDTTPVLDLSGKAIDTREYLIPSATLVRNTGKTDGNFCIRVDQQARRCWHLKFGNPDTYDLLTWDDNAIHLYEDRSQSEPSQAPPPLDYSFTDDVWVKRSMKPGDAIDHPSNVLVRFDPVKRTFFRSYPFPYTTKLIAVYQKYWFGGDVGFAPAICVEYRPHGGNPEWNFYALGKGLVIWRLFNRDTNAVMNESIINRNGGTVLSPTPNTRDALTVWPPVATMTSLTIKDGWQASGIAPFSARFEYQHDKAGSQTPEWVEWSARRQSDGKTITVRNPGSDTDHTFTLDAGSWDVTLTWPSGKTGKQRTVKVSQSGTGPTPPTPGGSVVQYAEFANMRDRLDDTYAIQHPVRLIPTHVDDGGEVWRESYFTRRAQGQPHEQAMRAIESEIDKIEGRPDRWAGPVPPPVPDPEPGSGTVEGRLRRDGRFFANDAGVFRPVFASMLAGCAPGKDYKTFLRWAKALGFNGVRVFCGALAWAGQTVEHVYANLPGLLDEAMTLGMYVQVCCITDSGTGYNIDQHLDRIGQIIAGRINVLPEMANEPYHATQSSQVHDLHWLALQRNRLPGEFIVAVGAGEDDETRDVNLLDWIQVHLDRSRDVWNQIRRVREMEALSAETGKPVMNGEPIGAAEPGTSGQRLFDAQYFFCLGALNRIFEVGGVFHFQDGLNVTVPIGPRQDECARAFISGFRAIETNERLTFKNATWSDSPVKNANFDNGVTRVYSGIFGNRGFTVTVGDTGNAGIEMQNGWNIVRNVAAMQGCTVYEIAR